MEVAPGHHQLVADPEPAAADRPPVGVEPVAERDVERIDPNVAAVDGREHLDVANGINAVVPGEPLGHERDDLLERGDGARTLDQEQVPPHLLRRREARRLAPPDRVCALDDHASRRLAEDVRQPGRRHRVRGDELGKRLAGADGSELIGVADEHDVRLGADGAQQRDEQLEVRHRRLVDDQQVAAQRIVLVVGGTLARNPPERGMDRGGAHPARLVHPDRRAPGRGDQQDARALTRGGGGDRPDRGGLAGPGTTGDQRHAVRERVADPGHLLVGQRGLRIRVRIAEAVAGLAVDQVVDALGQLGLELGGLRPVDPLLVPDEVAGVDQLVDVRFVRRLRPEQLVHRGQEHVERQARAAAALGLGQHVEHGRPPSVRAIGVHAESLGDLVGDPEADAEYARQLIGPVGHDPVSAVAVGLADPPRQVRQPVRGEQQMEAPRHAEPLPGAGRLCSAAAADTRRRERRVGVAIDHVEHRPGAVGLDEPRRALDADVLDPDEVGDCDGAVGVGGPERRRLGDLDLRSVAAVLHPSPDHASALLVLEVNEGADEHDRSAVLARRLDHRPARLVAREAGATDGHLGLERGHAPDIRPGQGGSAPLLQKRRNASHQLRSWHASRRA